MDNNKNALTKIALATLLVISASTAQACPVAARAANFPSSYATTGSSSITFKLSNEGTFTVTRTLADEVPPAVVACTVTLQGRYTRKNSLSKVVTLGTQSSLDQSVKFRAKKLPSVKPDKFRKQIVQPSLHLLAVTECTDSAGELVLSDTSPVVARYADCGSSRNPVSMQSFVSTLVKKLNR